MATRGRIKSEPEESQSADAMALIGEVLDGRYRVEELIGEGGMGRVYRAEHERLCRSVAIKILHAGLSGAPDISQRFEREARAIARLDHINCVSVLDFGTLEDGSLFLVMPYLPGIPLSALIERGPMSAQRALGLTRQLLRGLSHAHQAGIVHRDVKPDNIIVVAGEEPAETPKLLDFGIAKMLEGESSNTLTLAGQRFGTPNYMSPEQVLGAEVDERTDLYSLTVVLYEMLTGRLPFGEEGHDADMMMLHATQPAPTLAERFPEGAFSPALERLVGKGLQKRAKDRFADTQEYIEAIEVVLEGDRPRATSTSPSSSHKSAAADAPSWPTRARALWASRRARRAMLIGAGVALLAIAALVIAMLPAKEKVSEHAVEAERLLASGKPDEAIALLESQGVPTSEDALALLQLGHAYSASRRYAEALDVYMRAHGARTSVGEDRFLRANTLLMLDDERADTAVRASRFLCETLEDAPCRARVVELASSSSSYEHRQRMREQAEILGLGDQIDRLQSYQLDLRQGESCDIRQATVAQLRALGNPAAVPALEKARNQKRNACLKDDTADAIRFLQSVDSEEPSADDSTSIDATVSN